MSLEEAGREARYRFFRQAAFRLECGLVATAHTQDDLAETVLLNLARGTGLAGLAGIPERRDAIVRPLLPFTRAETREYCESQGLWFHDDPSNSDMSFARARVRLRVMPELDAINPRSRGAIARLAGMVSEEDRFLNGMAAAALEQSEIELNGALGFLTKQFEAAFTRARLAHLPAVLFKRAIRLGASALDGALNARQIETALASVAAGESGSVTAEGGRVVVEWDEERIVTRLVHPPGYTRFSLTVPGETSSEEFGWGFVAFEGPPTDTKVDRKSLSVELDSSKIRGSLYFRPAKAGDRMQPVGFKGHRKLSDLLSEAKLTQAARSLLPIVCDMVGPVWAPGVCLDHRPAKDDHTSRALILRFGEPPSLAAIINGNAGLPRNVAKEQ
jgi:tRNA(Ile)-lysidine synthase